MRLDFFVAQSKNISRNKAQDLIKNGHVFVNGERLKRSSQEINAQDVSVDLSEFYVSRAAFKLKNFLAPSLVANKTCLDIGASKGGFSQVLLELGAASVTAVDVGSNQFDKTLKKHKNLIVFEQTNIKDFTSKPFDLVVCDVSFVSVKNLLLDINRLSKSDIVILFKPQFEVGKTAKRTKKGVVTDTNAIKIAQEDFLQKTQNLGWELEKQELSSLKGKDGNAEFIYQFHKHRS